MASLRHPVRIAPRSSPLPYLFLMAVLCLTVLAPAVLAGEITPALQQELSQMGPTDQATVIFNLSEQANIPALNEALKLQHATRKERHRQVIEALQAAARESQGAVLRELDLRKITGEVVEYHPYWIANLVVVRATKSAIMDLANRSDIAVVEPNLTISLVKPVPSTPAPGHDPMTGSGVTPGLRAIHAPQVWNQLGITGVGVIVSTLDTGVDGNHPALAARWRGANGHPWQECWLDLLGTNTQFPTDTYGHGTHTMGTITGLSPQGDSIGVCPAAQWIACNVINQGVGPTFDAGVIQGFQWISDPDGDPNTVTDVPDVCSNSWRINEGFGGNYTDCDTRWWNAIDNCEAAGVAIVFAAGNEGPGPQTIGSPPDRAATLYNVFSVGAVDATSYNWPYPIASFSSRGPTGCNVSPALKIKPEVAAPGVNVYSSWPGGTYQNDSGTSMATPHVAGTIGLIRGANPDIDVDSIKQILIDTARDEGDTGEDNTYGNGFIDAYQAVLRSLTGYGTLSGNVTNASNGGTPIPGASVTLLQLGRGFTTDALGHYSGLAPAGTYTVEVTHPSFTTVDLPGVVLTAGQITTENFSLVDIVGPVITSVQYSGLVPNETDPIPVTANITDFSAIPTTQVYYRTNGGGWQEVDMASQGGGQYQGLIPGQPIGTAVDFYLRAVDIAGNATLSPSNAPSSYYSFTTVMAFFTDNFETDKNWVPFQNSDTQQGRSARWDPWGTTYNGAQIESPGDHTPAPASLCYETGVGSQGGPPSPSGVHNGCVTLTSPTIDLSSAGTATLTYYRWFAYVQGSGQGTATFTAMISSNGGLTWNTIEVVSANANQWYQDTFDLSQYTAFNNRVLLRFITCQNGGTALVESSLDDLVISGVPSVITSVSSPAPANRTLLFTNEPNPFSGSTALRYRLGATTEANLSIFTPSGRLVRTLAAGTGSAGEHVVVWDGRDDHGHAVSSGVYFYELQAKGFSAQKKMLMLK